MTDEKVRERIYVIAGTCQQAERWAREHGIQHSNLRHVISDRELRGLKPEVLHIVGTALRSREDIEQTLDYARAVGWKLDFGNPDGAKA